MWLLIAEDSVCAERTPPWGSPTIEEYAERLSKSLEVLERHHEVVLNFDFSAVELEDVARRRPDLVDRMRRLADRGRIAFVNGTYSQPHLHILSLESIIRQFEHGVSVIERLTGYRVTCYASQEPGFSQQLPQILRAFGYRTASTPDFPFAMKMMGRVQHWAGRWQWLAGEDLVWWVGIDHTIIPTWLKASGCPDERALADDTQRGLLHTTRLRVDMPDMVAVDEAWVEERTKSCRMVRLDRTLEEMAQEQPLHMLAMFEADYAYTEGVDAEALSRTNTRVENALLRLEMLSALLPLENKPDFDFDAAWRTLLAAQHHDAYWTGGPELRAKCISRLGELESKIENAALDLLRALGRGLPPAPEGMQAVVVVHGGSPSGIAAPELKVESGDVEVLDERGRSRSCRTRKLGDGSLRTTFPVPAHGLGYSTVFVRRGSAGPTRARRVRGLARLGGRLLSAAVREDARIESIRLDGRRVFSGSGNVWVCVREGRDTSPVLLEGSSRVERGQLYDALESTSELGSVRFSTRVTVGSIDRVVKIETELDFAEPTEVGDYFDDRTKLHIAWQVGSDVDITYISGGCPERATLGKSFIAYPAVDVVGSRCGLAIRFDSAAKCWLDEDGVLRCVIAWGHNGDRFHNRQGPLPGIMRPLNWLKPMDLRLRGKHLIRQTLLPHADPLSKADLIKFAFADALEPLAVPVETGGGYMPWSETLLAVRPKDFIVLSVRPAEGGAIARLLNASDRRCAAKLRLAAGWQAGRPRLLDGTQAKTVRPWGIVEVPLARRFPDGTPPRT